MSHETFQAPELDHLAELLPAFEFNAFIAKGGMGAVYKANQRSLDRDVAIKVLPREFGADPEFRSSFETEAKAMAKLNHPNLIGVYDFGDVEGMPYIVMEYVDGKSLYHSAWNKQIEPLQAVEIVKAICHGLGHAHENGIIHRDIKPANILLTPKAEPKIGDFGLAQPAGDDGSGIVMGTPGYSSPEYIHDHTSADHRADLYALGVILHELLTSQRPDPEGVEPRKHTGDHKLDAIWKKATQPDPNHRYATAEDMAKDLEAWEKSAAARSANPLLTAASGAAQRPPGQGSDDAPQVLAPTGSNWGMVRNLIIIAVLVVAIGFTYKLLKKVQAERAAENERIKKEQYEAEQLAKAEAARKAEEARREALLNQNKKPVKEPVDIPDKEPETPLESLDRLRYALTNGERIEMPIGTKRKGGSDFFLVETKMAWHQAAAFAEQYGGHLALVGADEDVNWFAEFLPGDSVAWIGSGRSGGKSWVQIDGSDWPLSKSPGGVGDYAAIDQLGLLRARPADAKLPFIIEWHRDGSNPATLAAMMRRTRETLDSPNPVFPPGTRSSDGRHFCIIPREIDFNEANRLAELAGGILAVPGDRTQAGWLLDQLDGMHASDGFWMGGSREDDVWKWNSGEPWKFAQWADSANPESGGTGMVIVPEIGWRDADIDGTASGLIIEWSSDAEVEDTSGEDIAEAGGSLKELNKLAIGALRRAETERDKKLTSNAKTFGWDLNVWFRGLNSTDTRNWKPHVEGLHAMVKGNRVPAPSDFGDDSDVQLSEQMAKVCKYCYQKQQEADLQFEAMTDRIRDAYVKKLESAAAEAKDSGQTAQVSQLQKAMDDASDLSSWVDDMLNR